MTGILKKKRACFRKGPEVTHESTHSVPTTLHISDIAFERLIMWLWQARMALPQNSLPLHPPTPTLPLTFPPSGQELRIASSAPKNKTCTASSWQHLLNDNEKALLRTGGRGSHGMGRKVT